MSRGSEMAKAAAPKTVTIDGEEMETLTVEYGGVAYTLRELSVEEGDAIDALSENQTPRVANRLMMRAMLEKSIIEPKVTMDQIGRWSGKKYVALSRAFNKLNTIPEENPTPPAGSAGPTSPDGGEPSPTA